MNGSQGVEAQVQLRGMGWRDLRAVAALERQVHPEDAWSLATWWAELAGRPRRDYSVLTQPPARSGPALPPVVVAYAGLDLAGETVDLMTLAVDPGVRGRGHGRRMMDHLHARAAVAGAHAVVLEVREDNMAARALYDRCGYVQVHRRRGYYQPGAVDALVLRRDLGDLGELSDSRGSETGCAGADGAAAEAAR